MTPRFRFFTDLSRGISVAAAPLLGLGVLALAAGCATHVFQADAAPSAPPPAPTERPTEAFRAHHAEIREHLGHIDAMAVALRQHSPEEQRGTMRRAVTFLKDHIARHAADEERVLYPVVQRESGEGSQLTTVPIYEHRIVERLIATLDQEASQPSPDPAAFALAAHHLTGLLHAHFEVEEEVLLPVLDKTMTAAQFQREVAEKMPH
jgi:hemerythrin-like domain-containing protein